MGLGDSKVVEVALDFVNVLIGALVGLNGSFSNHRLQFLILVFI